MSKSVNVKATLKEHHCLQIPKHSHPLEKLKTDIKQSFPLLNQEHITIKLYWRDEDGDSIPLLTDEDLRQAQIRVDGKLNLEIEADVRQQLNRSQHAAVAEIQHTGHQQVTYGQQNCHHMRTQTSTEEHSIRSCSQNIPETAFEAAMPDTRQARYPPVNEENISQSFNSGSSSCHTTDQQTVVMQTTSETFELHVPRACLDQLDIEDDILCIEDWPSNETYALNMFSKMKRTLDQNFIPEKTYRTDPDRQCRVLCIINNESRGESLYTGNGIDMECTYLQQLKKKLKWDLQIHKNKTSTQITEILNQETERDFNTVHSLFVIIISRGDKYGMFGTTGESIDYTGITTRFNQVEGLKGKPKIFIMDDCDLGSDIRGEMRETSTGVQESHISQNFVTNPKQLVHTLNGGGVLPDERDATSISNVCMDTFVCRASSFGRCDKIVKGSWVIGALISVICKAGNKLTFQRLMRQVDMILREAEVPGGRKAPELLITDDLKKDFYLLPPPC